MPKVSLPPGCFGLDMADGARYNADRNGQVRVAERHADAIRRGWYGRTGVMVATEPHQVGTKAWRTCVACSPTRRWNKWTTHCPRCETETIEE